MTLRLLSLFALLAPLSLLGQCFSDQFFNSVGVTDYTVPGGISQQYTIEIETRGADGGDFLWGSNPQTNGGEGATMTSTFMVNGGDVLRVMVGQSGFDAIGSPGGGGGGGGTAVIINSSDVLIAAGAGGGGGQGGGSQGEGGRADSNSPAQGGAGPGASGGGGFNSPGMNGLAGTGGGAGTLTGTGAGGTQGVVAGPGGSGFGGGGGGSGTGGGGGGGYQGGDGSQSGNLAGLAGNSFVSSGYGSSLVSAVAGFTGGGNNVDGSVRIECLTAGVNVLNLSLVAAIDPPCGDVDDGSIEVTATGGTPPYTYMINGGPPQSSGLFTGLMGNVYDLEVMDDAGDNATLPVSLSQPAVLSLSVPFIADNSCFGESLGLIETLTDGGVAPYTYTINGVFSTQGFFDFLPNGTYLIEVTDANDCMATATGVISSPDQIQIIVDNATGVTCNGGADGTAQVSASGGSGTLEYSLDGGAFSTTSFFTNLTGGNHVIEVRDIQGCIEFREFLISEPSAVAVVVESQTDATCTNATGGSVEVLATGGAGNYSYSIDGLTYGPSPLFDGLAAGTYTLYVLDANACSATTMVTIANDGGLTTTLSSKTDIACAGDSTGVIEVISIGASGVVTYTLEMTSNTTGVFEGLPAGDYTVSAIDAGGCASSVSTTLTESSPLVLSVVTVPTTCAGSCDGMMDILVTGGVSPYTISVDGVVVTNSLTGLCASTRTIQVLDSLGCMVVEMATVGTPAPLVMQVSDLMQPGCDSSSVGSATVALSGGTPGFRLVVNGDTTAYAVDTTVVLHALVDGDYQLQLLDARDCVALDSFTVKGVSPIMLSVTGQDVMCSSGTSGRIVSMVSGGTGQATYTLDTLTNETGLFEGLTAGDYTVMARDSNGCTDQAILTIGLQGEIDIATTLIPVSCADADDGMISVEVPGTHPPYAITIGGIVASDGIAANLSPGRYPVMVIDGLGCMATDTAVVTQPDSLVITSAVVNKDTVTILAKGGTMPYLYSDGRGRMQTDNQFAMTGSGNYTFTVVDANGCSAEIDVVLTSVVAESGSRGQLTVYPNPASDRLIIEHTGAAATIRGVEIFDMQGQLMTTTVQVADHLYRMEVGTLPKGVYLLQVTVEGAQYIERVVLID